MTVHSSPDRPERGDRGDRSGDKRERILVAAERIFARHGFFAARVSDIAREAGVADGTIYLYFKSKDDLLISLFENRMKQVNDRLRQAIADRPPTEQLRAFVHTYLQLVSDEPAAAEVLTIELRQSSKFMKEYDNPQFADFLRMLGGIIADGQARGELDAAIPGPAPGTRPKKFDIVRAADWVVAMVTGGLEQRQANKTPKKETPT